MPQLSPVYWVLASLFGILVFIMVMFCYSMMNVKSVFYYNSMGFSLMEWYW